ncbi:hypothetical protein [Flammeovirga pacifica]|uniref:DUF3899 domain-containing protein n=1 Tax=Flammeovirga pacifica TaxID=915059 RepID=A0A1S1Z0D1_FLAPC|nr:hypothetical protein [Flammeovirga pacifica]OHX66728.1 hypothetical protein NH26_10345 [Flammeovirga pacifica]
MNSNQNKAKYILSISLITFFLLFSYLILNPEGGYIYAIKLVMAPIVISIISLLLFMYKYEQQQKGAISDQFINLENTSINPGMYEKNILMMMYKEYVERGNKNKSLNKSRIKYITISYLSLATSFMIAIYYYIICF